MDRLACIDVPSLALQVALRRFSPGFQEPLALVKDDRPSSPIVHLNRPAGSLGLRVGMRYSEGLSLCPDLKAVTVLPRDLEAARQEVLAILIRWSPSVEVCPFDPQSFWAGTGGLSTLYGTEAEWGTRVRDALGRERYRAVVVVGQTRGGTYVLAKTRRRSTVVRSPAAEARALESAPLVVFPLGGRNRRLLDKLGLRTVAQVLQVPAEELSRRFGPDFLGDLRRLETWTCLPLQPATRPDQLVRSRRLDPPTVDRQDLLPLVKGPLQDGLVVLGRQARLLAELRLVFVLESGGLVTEVLRPAEPTVEPGTLVRLLDLRLARIVLPEAVAEIRLAFDSVPLPPSSGELFAPAAARDLRRGAEALALVRAQWGNAAVVRPALADSHVPELSFRWEEFGSLVAPVPGVPGAPFPTAVRRVPRLATSLAGNPAGRRLGTACRLQVRSGPVVMDKEYWFLSGSREVAWVSWDRLTGSTRWEGTVD